MRKNGVNKELRRIEGGICAPVGFLANALPCRMTEGNPDKKDLGLVYAERRCPAACIYTQNASPGAPVKITQKHFKSGYAQALILNSGIANMFQNDGERLAETVCGLVSKYAKVDVADVGIASKGAISKNLSLLPIETQIQSLVGGLDRSVFKSRAAAAVLSSDAGNIREVAYEFDLGDYPCKIGAIFSGFDEGAQGDDTVLSVITTDVCISPAMLQRALSIAASDTFYLLNINGVSSPNDTICIFSSCKAGNYKIDQEDSEFKKFCNALRAVAYIICKQIAESEREKRKAFECRVFGVKSKQLARTIAKELVGNWALKSAMQNGQVRARDIFSLITRYLDDFSVEETEVYLSSTRGRILLYGEGNTLSVRDGILKELIGGDELAIEVYLGKGNYSATSVGGISIKWA